MHNEVQLIGRLGKDPTTFTLQNGGIGAFLSVATTDKGKGDKKETQWHTVVVYDKLAELCIKYLKSGRLVHVVGPLQYRQKEKDGVKYIEAKIKALTVNFLDSSTEYKGHQASQEAGGIVKYVEGAPSNTSALYGHSTKYVEHSLESTLKFNPETDLVENPND